jgi:hypothetical protein
LRVVRPSKMSPSAVAAAQQSCPDPARQQGRDPAGSWSSPPPQSNPAPLGFEKFVELPAHGEGIQFRIIGDRCIDVLVPEKLGDWGEGAGTMLLHQPSREVRSWCGVISMPTQFPQHPPDLLRQRVWLFMSLTDGNRKGLPGAASTRRKRRMKRSTKSRRAGIVRLTSIEQK